MIDSYMIQSSTLTLLFIVIGVAVLGVLLFFIKELRSSLNEAKVSNAHKHEQLKLSMIAGRLTAWSYDVSTKCVHDIHGNKSFNNMKMEKMVCFIHHDDIGKFNKALEDLSSGEKNDCNIVVKVLQPRTGEYLHIDCSMKAVKDGQGKTIEIISIQKDITERIKQKNEREELLKRMSVMFNDSEVGITIYDKDGYLLDLNKEMCRMLGIDNKDMLIEAHPSLLDDPNMSENDKQRIINGERFCYRESINFTKTSLYKFYTSSRYDTIVLERKAVPIISTDGKHEGTIVTTIDITDKEELNDTVQQLKLEQDRIISQCPVGIAIFDANGALHMINKAMIQMFRIKKANFHGDDQHLGILFNMPFPKDVLEQIKAGKPGEFNTAINPARFRELVNIDTDDFKDKWCSVRYCAMQMNGNISSYILIVRDITQIHLHNLILQRSNCLNEVAVSMCNLMRWSYYSDTQKFCIKLKDGKKLTIEKSNASHYIDDQSIGSFYQMLVHLDNNEQGIYSCSVDMDLYNTGKYYNYEIAGCVRDTKFPSPYAKSIGYIRDNSEHHSVINKLKNVSLLNRIILTNTDSMMVYADAEGKILWENVSDKFPSKVIGTKLFVEGKYCYETHGIYKEPCVKCLVFSTVNDKKRHSETKKLIDGTVIKLESSPVFNEDNVVSGVAIKVIDITKQQKVDAEIQALRDKASDSRLMFRTIIDHIPATLFVKDVTNKFKYLVCNRTFCQIMNLAEEQMIGKNDFEIMTEERAKFFYESDIETVKLNGKPYIKEYLNDEYGELHYIRTTKIMIDATDCKLLIGITADLTGIKRTNDALKEAKEHAEQSDKLKSAFLANMSHEIRTPLNAIVGFSQLLKESVSDEERDQYIDIININNQLLLRLINDILDLSKIDSGTIELQPIEINIEDLFMEVTSAAAHSIEKESVKLITESQYESCICLVDKDRLLQIWNNFTSNAIKHTIEGYIKIGYECRDNGLYFYVEDTGTGIDDSMQDRIFERFEKLDNYAQGCGLGLAICKALVKLFNGKIGFKSEKGKGSFFWAWIPTDCKVIEKQKNADCPHDNLHIN